MMNRYSLPTVSAWAALLLLACPGVVLRAPAETSPPSMAVQRGNLCLSARASGSIAWSTQIPVLTPMAGRIDKWNVVEDQLLRKGERAGTISSPQRAILMDLAQTGEPEEQARWEQVYQPVPVLSPMDGTAFHIQVMAGQNIGPGQVLFSIGDVLVARMYVEEMDIPLIHAESTATLTIDAVPNQTLTGTVVRVGSQSTPYRNAVAYEVDLSVEAWPDAAKPGMSLSARFAGPSSKDTLIVPCTAVLQENGESRVCRMEPDGSTSFRAVRTGLSDGVEIEILDGLQDGDQVLVDAALSRSADPADNPRYSPLLPFTRGQ